MVKDDLVPSAHDFTGNLEDWERRIFLNAEYFRVHRFYGQGRHDSMQTTDFLKALERANEELALGRRVLIYVVTIEGRFVVIPQKLWEDRKQLWLEKKGK